MSLSFRIVIPARFASSRLPGKPLADIGGKPMVQWVYEKAISAGADEVLVAVDDQRVADVVSGFGGRWIMTPPELPSGTDRLQFVAATHRWSEDTIVVNVQGDEPLLPPALIKQVAANLQQRPDYAIATLYEALHDVADIFNPNVVKLVNDLQGRAMYFSRSPMPWQRGAFDRQGVDGVLAGRWKRHLGMYAYRVGFLHRYVSWQPSALEQLEQLEQLRALENGALIHVAEAAERSIRGVDTESDLAWVRDYVARQ